MAKIGIRDRFRAWWDGYEVADDKPASRSAIEPKSDYTAVGRKDCIYDPRTDIEHLLFGEGQHLPGGPEMLFSMVNEDFPLAGQFALMLGCGSGGMCRDMMERFKVITHGMEPDRLRLTASQKLLKRQIEAHRALVGPVKLDEAEFTRSHYHLVMAREILHLVDDRHDIYGRVERSLRKGGRFCFTQLVATDGTDTEALSNQLVSTLEPEPATFLTAKEEIRRITESGLEVVTSIDATDQMLKSTIEIFSGWQRVVEQMANYTEHTRMLQELVGIVNHWQKRTDAIKANKLGIVMFKTAKRVSEFE